MKEKTAIQPAVLEGLNDQQIKAVTADQGPLLIIAGAGTGKTTVLTRRITWLLEQGLAKPEEILALTFTEKAANEMEERVDQLLPLGYVNINISTFHAFAQKILQQYALDIGLPGDFRVLTETKTWMLIKNHLHEFQLDYYKPFGNPNKFIHALLKHFGKAKGEEITPDEYLEYAEGLRLNKDRVEKSKSKKVKAKIKSDDEIDERAEEQETARILEVANAYHKYQKLLLDNSYFDFGDLINYSLKLFRTRPKVLHYYQKQYKYILVDEFQDTDLSQYEMVKLLALPENNLTVVGDDDQSIYKFRGASVSNILKFKEDYPKAKEITLVDNYRSVQNILDLSYAFIQQNNPERLESKLKIVKKLKSHNDSKGIIEVLHGQTIHDEVRVVADKIVELNETAGLNWNDFAILVRANDHAEPFILELNRRGIPFIFVANRGLYKKPFILSLLAYFNLLDNRHESENLFRILNMEMFRITDEDLISLSQAAKRKALSLFEALKHARNLVQLDQESHKKLDKLVELVNKHTNLARETPISELIVKILDDLGIIKKLLLDSIKNAENRNLLEQFYRKAQNFENDNTDMTLKGFLNQIRLELEAGDQGELAFNPDLGPEAVRIMTVHSAKGLEFKCVFVVNLVDQRFPSRERKEQIEIPTDMVKEILPEGDIHLMEERRLFYVASTRAKQYLYFAWSDDYGGSTHKKPSRFLVELSLANLPKNPKPVGEVFFTKQKSLPKVHLKYYVPDTFSFSQINCFRNCPLEYKLRYVYQLPLAGNPHLSLGDTVHKALQKFLEHYKQVNSQKQTDLFGSKTSGFVVPDFEVLKKFYSEVWMDDWYPDKIEKEKGRKRGLEMLQIFHKRFSENPRKIEFLEQKFKLRLGDYKFTGKIDRADLNDNGTIDIIDYKTGQVKEKLTSEDKNQLLIYQWAAQEEFKKKVNSLRYWYLASIRDSQEFIGSQQEIDAVKTQLLETIEQIVEAIKGNSFLELDNRMPQHDCKYRHLQ
ncbi:MAG TPA: ATP-dependent DNA helicase [Patescibacteria group bacterium]|jgi:DNA helicase-2/ATP-dependent DNA helicase PcrA|nr:ATP-dependent DNA helicase [Patescibacteria group bacterium]